MTVLTVSDNSLSVRVEQLTPGHPQYPMLERILIDNPDPVHRPKPAETWDRQIRFLRIASGESAKRCWISSKEPSNLYHFPGVKERLFYGQPDAVLYGYCQDNHIADEYDLSGDLSKILRTPARQICQSDPTAIVFYSVAALPSGDQKPTPDEATRSKHNIIRGVFSEWADKHVWLATLSPMRGFAQWAKDNEIPAREAYENGEAVALREFAMLYLLYRSDLTQKLHLSNGAWIGDINLESNTPESVDARKAFNVTVNYGYKTARDDAHTALGGLQARAAMYGQGIMTVSERLAPLADKVIRDHKLGLLVERQRNGHCLIKPKR